MMVHGYDFVAIGNDVRLKELDTALRDRYKIKSEVLGPDPGDVREVKIFNKIIRLTSGGYELEADPRHAELAANEMEVEGCKPMRTPSVKDYTEPEGPDRGEEREGDRGRRVPGGDDQATVDASR